MTGITNRLAGVVFFLGVLTVVGLLLLQPSPFGDVTFTSASAESNAETAGNAKKTFFGFDWRTQPDDIYDSLGDPRKKHTVNNGTRGSIISVIYRDQKIHGRRGSVKFIFSTKEGLIKGVLKVPLKSRRNCLNDFRTFASKIARDYRNFQRSTKRTNTLNAPFCNSLLLRKAATAIVWHAPDTRARASLSLGLYNKDKITLFVESSYGPGPWLDLSTRP